MLIPKQLKLKEPDEQYICGELQMYQVCSLLEHIHAQQARIVELEQKLAALETWSEEDKPLPEDADIEAAHPLSTGRHDIHAEASRIVGAKRSKFALIAVVNWLLVRADADVQDANRYRFIRDTERLHLETDDGEAIMSITFNSADEFDKAVDQAMEEQ